MALPYVLRVSYEGLTYDIKDGEYDIPSFSEGKIKLSNNKTVKLSELDYIVIMTDEFEKILNGVRPDKKYKEK